MTSGINGDDMAQASTVFRFVYSCLTSKLKVDAFEGRKWAICSGESKM